MRGVSYAKTLLRKHGHEEVAERIFRRVSGRVIYGRLLHVFWSPSTDEIQMRLEMDGRVHRDAIHVNTYRWLQGRDDLREEYIEDDLIDMLRRYSRGEK